MSPAARAHDQALERRHAHRGVDRLARLERAVTLAPLPRWQVMRLQLRPGRAEHARPRSRPRSGARCRGSRSGGRRASRQLVGQGVRVRARAAVWWNAVSKTATCGTAGQQLLAGAMPARLAGLCSGASCVEARELGEHGRHPCARAPGSRAAVHHAVPDRDDAVRIGDACQRLPQCDAMIGGTVRVFTDALDLPAASSRSSRKSYTLNFSEELPLLITSMCISGMSWASRLQPGSAVYSRIMTSSHRRCRHSMWVGIHADEGLDACFSGFGLRRTLAGLKPDPQDWRSAFQAFNVGRHSCRRGP